MSIYLSVDHATIPTEAWKPTASPFFLMTLCPLKRTLRVQRHTVRRPGLDGKAPLRGARSRSQEWVGSFAGGRSGEEDLQEAREDVVRIKEK